MVLPQDVPTRYSELETLTKDAGQPGLVPLWNHKHHGTPAEYCLHWCAFNSAIQMIALMPGVRQYLKRLCSRCDPKLLPLHCALYEQLEELAVALVAHKPATVDTLMKALDKSPVLCNVAQRVGHGPLASKLYQHLGVDNVLNPLFQALQQEYLESMGQDTSYWTAMLSCATKSHTKCDSGSKCESSQEGASAPVKLDARYSLIVPLNGQHGDSQRVSTIISNSASCRAECGNCAARARAKCADQSKKVVAKPIQLTKREQFVRLPVVLQLFVCAQQDTHDEAKADYSNKGVGMKLEATIQLQDDSGMVEYQLMLVIFREGQHNNGHYYVAAPTPADTWVMFNNHQGMMPMQLRDLQKNYGKRVHGVVYRRKSAPAEDDWACLNPTALFGTNAPRPVNASQPLSQDEVFEQQLQQALNASMASSKSSGAGETLSRPVKVGTASHSLSEEEMFEQQLEQAIQASLAHQGTAPPQRLPHPAPPPPQPTPAMSDRSEALSKSSRACKARPPPRPVKASSGPFVPQKAHQQQLRQASLADEGGPPLPTQSPPRPTPALTGRGQGPSKSSRPRGQVSRDVYATSGSQSLPKEARQQQLQQAPPVSLAHKGALASAAPSSSPPSSTSPASPSPPPPAAAQKEVAAARPQASRASKAGRHRANRQPAALHTIADLESGGKAVPAAFRQPAPKPALKLKSEEDMLAEVAVHAGLQDKLISAKHGSADTAVSNQYTVSQGQRAHQPLAPDTAAANMDAEKARLLALAAARADAKTAAEQHAAAVTAGGKGGKKGKKASKAVTAPEQKNAVQAEVKGQVAACQAQQLPADTAKGDATATTAATAKITASTATKSETKAEVEGPAADDLKAAEAQAKPLKHAEATTQAQAKAAKRARTKAAKATAKHAQAANAKAAGGGPVAQAQAEAAASSATPKLPTTQKANTGNTATSAPLNTKQRMEGPQQGTTTSQQISGDPSKSDKPQKGSSLEQKPAAGTAICSQQQPAKTPATQEQTIKHSTSQPAVNAQAGAHTVSKAQAVPAKAAKARAGQAGAAKATAAEAPAAQVQAAQAKAAKATATQVPQAAAASADAVKPDAQAPAAAMSYTRAAVVASRHDKPQTSISHARADEVKAMSQDQAACKAEREAQAAEAQQKAANDGADAVGAKASASAAAESDAKEQVAAELKAAAATAQAQTLKETTAATKAQAKAAKRARTKAAKAIAKQASNAKAAGGGPVAQAQAEAAVTSATAEARAVAELKAEEAKSQAQTQALAKHSQVQAQAQGEDEAQARGEAKAAPAAAILAKAGDPEAAQKAEAEVKAAQPIAADAAAAEAAAVEAQLQAAVDATAPAAAVTETKAEMVAPAEAQQKAADDAAITIKADASAPATAEADTKAEPEMLAGTELKAAKARAQASASTTKDVQAAHAKTVQAKAVRAKAPETNQIQGSADMFAEHRAHSRNPKPPGKGRWRRWCGNALKGTLAVGAGMLLASAVHKLSKRA